MIEAHNLSKKYGDSTAVTDVSFTARSGEIVGFLGPNGAGKTTTIRMLTTFLPPSGGSATVAGYDILTSSNEVRRRIGYLPETPPLYEEMTVIEYLDFVARLKGIQSSVLKDKRDSVIESCALKEVRKQICKNLSKGYRQRVGIAQAVIHDPEVIILDEPTSGLDPKQIVEIRSLIASLSEKHTVLLSTHILQEVSIMCSKVVIINRGKTVLEGDLKEVTKGISLEQVFLEKLHGDLGDIAA